MDFLKKQLKEAKWPLLAFICFCAFLVTVSVFICQYSGWQKELETTTKYLEECLKQQGDEVIVATDKTEYRQGEEIKIGISNKKIKTISYNSPFLFGVLLQKKDALDWKEVSYFSQVQAKAVCLGIMYEKPDCLKLSSNEEYKDTWDQKIFECGDDAIIEKMADGGSYRFVFYYWENDRCFGVDKKLAYSDEYIIKSDTNLPELEIPSEYISGSSRYSRGDCQKDTDCYIGGCSGEVCASEPDIITTCEVLPDFPDKSIYECGCVNGVCGWRFQ